MEIVGVVGHVKHNGLVAADAATVRSRFYVPHMQLHDVIAPLAASAVAVMIKSPVSTQSLLATVRRELTRFDPTQAVVDARRMEDVVSASLAGQCFFLVVLGGFTAIALTPTTIAPRRRCLPDRGHSTTSPSGHRRS